MFIQRKQYLFNHKQYKTMFIQPKQYKTLLFHSTMSTNANPEIFS